MKVRDFMMADLAVILQGALLSCDDTEAEALADAVPYIRTFGMEERRRRVATWMRRVFAFLAGRLDDIPEGPPIDGKEIIRRMHDAAGLGIGVILNDPVLRPLLSEKDRQNAEEGLLSMNEIMDAISRRTAGEGTICPECRTPMISLFTSLECPFCS